MKEKQEYEKDLASIRLVMERSVKFISLSGFSGILAGVYALAGSAYAYTLLYYPEIPLGNPSLFIADHPNLIFKLQLSAALVFILSVGTAYLFSWFKAKKLGIALWSSTSRQLLSDLLIPLCAGGIFILILLSQEYYQLIAPLCLLVYGLTLLQCSRNTFREIRYLGVTEIFLGLIATLRPDAGLVIWAFGFGLTHIIYGAVMYFRYDR
ncbi:MAG: hypothetical protein JST48_09580 [Bacteroidetes bacterium]|nr:hypothetical protein [Bacteroidota bacterium]